MVRRHVASICAIPSIQNLTFRKNKLDQNSDEGRSGELSGGTQEAPRRHPGGSQEAPSRHPEAPKGPRRLEEALDAESELPLS